jgi:hypothetical protein
LPPCESIESEAYSQRRRRGAEFASPKVRYLDFDDQVALDHIIARNPRNLGFQGQTAAITLVDRATGFKWGGRQKQKTGAANLEVVQRFQGPDDEDEIKYVWSDAAPEIIYAITKLGIRGDRDTSIPGDSQDATIEISRWARHHFWLMPASRWLIGPSPCRVTVLDKM